MAVIEDMGFVMVRESVKEMASFIIKTLANSSSKSVLTPLVKEI